MNKYAGFYAAYNASVKKGNTLTKEEVLLDFTAGKTSSLKDLSAHEIEALIRSLNGLSGFVPGTKHQDDKADKMRKGIIAIFKKMGRTAEDAKIWAEKQGVRGNKRLFNHYTTGELFVLIQVAQKIADDQHHALRKRMKTID